jgi:2-enoate reductase
VITTAERRKSVLVVGGGPAGLSAAITAALRGHRVHLWEKRGRLGGNLVPASAPDFKKDVDRFLSYLVRKTERLGFQVHVLKEATPESVLEEEPDVVVIATGSRPFVPELPGIGGDNVATAVDVLMGKEVAGDAIAVVGGGVVGCETALFLADTGKAVSIVDEAPILTAEPVFLLNYMSLLELLEEREVEVLDGNRLLEVDPTGVVLETDGEMSHLYCDSVVLALGMQSENGLMAELEGLVPEVVMIGDAVRPRKILDAVWEGYDAARVI